MSTEIVNRRPNKLTILFGSATVVMFVLFVGVLLMRRTESVDVASGRIRNEWLLFSFVLSRQYDETPFFVLQQTYRKLHNAEDWQTASRRSFLRHSSASFRGGRVISFFHDIAGMINQCELSDSDKETVLSIAISLAQSAETGLVGSVKYVDREVEIYDSNGVLLWARACGNR